MSSLLESVRAREEREARGEPEPAPPPAPEQRIPDGAEMRNGRLHVNDDAPVDDLAREGVESAINPPREAAAKPSDRVVVTLTATVPVNIGGATFTTQVPVPITAHHVNVLARNDAEALHNAFVGLAGQLGCGAATILFACEMLKDTVLRHERARDGVR